MERSVVSYGSTEIAYAVQRSARRRTVSIVVDTDSRVVVTAPAATPLARLDGVVRQKAPWIVDRLRRRSDLPPRPPEREFVSGETFYYLGRQYRLHLERGAPAPVRLHDRRLWLSVPRDLPPGHEHRYARAALTDWYIARANAVMPKKASHWSERVGVTPSKVLVTSAEKRWGSASKDGTLRFNWRVVQAPPALVDYVVVHELVHLIHRDHGIAYWSAVERTLPDYANRRTRLRALGAEYVW